MKKGKRPHEPSDVEMDSNDPRVGDVVVSLAGHDAGCLLVILAGMADGSVLVADGKTRSLAAPKRKKMRHLSKITRLGEDATDAMRCGTMTDCRLQKLLSSIDLEALTE